MDYKFLSSSFSSLAAKYKKKKTRSRHFERTRWAAACGQSDRAFRSYANYLVFLLKNTLYFVRKSCSYSILCLDYSSSHVHRRSSRSGRYCKRKGSLLTEEQANLTASIISLAWRCGVVRQAHVCQC